MNRSVHTVLNLPLQNVIVLERGKDASIAEKLRPSYSMQLLRELEDTPEPAENERLPRTA